MRAFIGIVALNAVLNVLLMTDSMDGLMWIMTGAAFHLAIGSEVALAAEHPHGLVRFGAFVGSTYATRGFLVLRICTPP